MAAREHWNLTLVVYVGIDTYVSAYILYNNLFRAHLTARERKMSREALLAPELVDPLLLPVKLSEGEMGPSSPVLCHIMHMLELSSDQN